jgi:hypothetical protein
MLPLLLLDTLFYLIYLLLSFFVVWFFSPQVDSDEEVPHASAPSASSGLVRGVLPLEAPTPLSHLLPFGPAQNPELEVCSRAEGEAEWRPLRSDTTGHPPALKMEEALCTLVEHTWVPTAQLCSKIEGEWRPTCREAAVETEALCTLVGRGWVPVAAAEAPAVLDSVLDAAVAAVMNATTVADIDAVRDAARAAISAAALATDAAAVATDAATDAATVATDAADIPVPDDDDEAMDEAMAAGMPGGEAMEVGRCESTKQTPPLVILWVLGWKRLVYK